MGLLKTLVIVLATLIIVAIGLLGYGFVKKTADPNWRLFNIFKHSEERKTPFTLKATSKPDLPTIKPWGNIHLDLPAECQIFDFKTNSNRLYIFIKPAGFCEQIIIIDLSNGQTIGSVKPRQ